MFENFTMCVYLNVTQNKIFNRSASVSYFYYAVTIATVILKFYQGINSLTVIVSTKNKYVKTVNVLYIL